MFWGENLYEASIVEVRDNVILQEGSKPVRGYRAHFHGWAKTWDCWLGFDELILNDEKGKSIAAALESRGKKAFLKRKHKEESNAKSHGRKRQKLGTPSAEEKADEIKWIGAEGSDSPTAHRIDIPLPLKKLLVEDWENIVSNRMIWNHLR